MIYRWVTTLDDTMCIVQTTMAMGLVDALTGQLLIGIRAVINRAMSKPLHTAGV